jgi:hypothetical protein
MEHRRALKFVFIKIYVTVDLFNSVHVTNDDKTKEKLKREMGKKVYRYIYKYVATACDSH